VKKVVTGIEVAHVIKAEPAVFAGPIKTWPALSGRSELARSRAAGHIALPAAGLMPAMETVVSHGLSHGDTITRMEV
jgi:hypothetical protein